MRGPLLALLVVAVSLAPLPAETILQEEFRPFNAEIMGQGGSSAAVAEGLAALMTNPALIPYTEGTELSFPALTFWAHTRPDLLLRTAAALSGQDIEQSNQQELIIDVLTQQFTTNGFGVGTSATVGWVGPRAGIGLEVGADVYIYGDTFPLGLQGEIDSHISLMIGYGQPFVVGPIDLSVGVALRPHVRVNSFIESREALTLLSSFIGLDTGGGSTDPLQAITALNGFGVSFDGGALMRWRSFTAAVQARNLLNTTMAYTNNSLQTIIDRLAVGALPNAARVGDAEYVGDSYVIPLELTFGLAWQPDLGRLSALVRPELHAQIVDPFGLTDPNPTRPRSLWTRMHIGTEIRLLDFVDLRAGLNQGYVTAGFGAKLAFLELNYAIFSRELGRFPGDQRSSGVALDIAVRF